MRSEEVMMKLITEVAERDERIRGLYMNGSRTNARAKKDLFQDYDFVYIVTETASFIEDEKWIHAFGEILYMQLPDRADRMLGHQTDWDNCYGYLVQLADGNRVDIHIQTIEYSMKDIEQDKLCIILLDKDQKLPQIVQATDKDHWVKKPSEAEYICCCNEFWWILNNVGKGLWRREIPYIMDMIHLHLRPQFMKMISWNIGVQTQFSCSVGKAGKYMDQYMEEEQWNRILRTYSSADIEYLWQSVFRMCDMFDSFARAVGHSLGYTYHEQEAHNSRLFFDCTYELPADADEMLMVRRMTDKDADKVAQIWLEENIRVHSFIPESYWRDNCEMVKNQLVETEVYVYEDYNGIWGFIGIDKGYIKGIFVKKEVRSKGIGRALMSVCKFKHYKMYLYVYCDNISAVNFYMKQGFKISKRKIDADTNFPEYEMIWRKE